MEDFLKTIVTMIINSNNAYNEINNNDITIVIAMKIFHIYTGYFCQYRKLSVLISRT